MIPHPQRIGDDRQGWIHRATGGKEASIHHIEVLDLMGAAVQIQHRGERILPEAAGSHLMGDAFDGQLAREVALRAAHEVGGMGVDRLGTLQRAQNLDPALLESCIGGAVVLPVLHHDAAVLEPDPVVGIGQVFGGQPPVDRMAGDLLGGQRGIGRRIGAQHLAVHLPQGLDLTHGMVPALLSPVEVVDRERLLEHRGVRLQGDPDHRPEHMLHQVSAHQAGAVGQAVGMGVTAGAQQQGRRVHRTAGGHHDLPPEAAGLPLHHRLHPLHPGARGVHRQPFHPGVRKHRDARVPKRRKNAADLGIRLGVHEAGEAIAGVAADAGAQMALGLVEADAERRGVRVETLGAEPIGDVADAWLMAHRRMGIVAAAGGLGGVAALPAMDLIELFGPHVVGLEVAVAQGPGG